MASVDWNQLKLFDVLNPPWLTGRCWSASSCGESRPDWTSVRLFVCLPGTMCQFNNSLHLICKLSFRMPRKRQFVVCCIICDVLVCYWSCFQFHMCGFSYWYLGWKPIEAIYCYFSVTTVGSPSVLVRSGCGGVSDVMHSSRCLLFKCPWQAGVSWSLVVFICHVIVWYICVGFVRDEIFFSPLSRTRCSTSS